MLIGQYTNVPMVIITSSVFVNNELSLYQSDLAITGLFAVSFN